MAESLPLRQRLPSVGELSAKQTERFSPLYASSLPTTSSAASMTLSMS